MRIDFRGYVPFHSMLQWLPGMFGYCKLYHPRMPEEHAARKVHLPSNHLKHSDFYEHVLGTEGTTCLLPAELHPGTVKMSLFGYDAESDTTLRATTVPVTLHIRPSGFVEDGATPIPPTPDPVYAAFEKAFRNANWSKRKGWPFCL